MSSEFENYRALLFSIAYRMMGSAADAEDLVQDAYVRFAATERDVVRDVKAFLTTVLTRLALDRLKSAQHQREQYIGPWLPEPVLTDRDPDDALASVTREEKIELALLTALERLTPQERAVLLLHDVLDHDHNEIAEILDITAASSRQLLHRAKERVGEDRTRFTPTRDQQQRLVESFFAAVAAGDVDGLRNVLASDVVSRGDGGGKAFAARRPLTGFEEVSRFLLGIARKAPEGFSAEIVEVNAAPAILTRVHGAIFSVLAFAFDGERITEIYSILNPDKLAFLKRQAE